MKDIVDQDQMIAMLLQTFSESKVVDRRINPSHGYRAVHVIITREGLNVEIQIRSSLQHLWAELSERLADVIDSSIKYGGGEPQIQRYLSLTSEHIAKLEKSEKELSASEETFLRQGLESQSFQEIVARDKNILAEIFRDLISRLHGPKR